MIRDDITSTDRDHLWWLDKTGVSLAVELHVDLGCGGGGLGRALISRGVQLSIGADIIEANSSHSAIDGYRYLKLDLNRPDWTDHIRDSATGRDVDLVTAFDFLEHVDSPWGMLQDVRRMLKPGGHLVLTTPNVMSWERFVKPTHWSGVRDPQHKILLQPYTLRFLLERAGYQIESLHTPLRSLGRLGWYLPIGAQMIAVARRI